MGRREGRARSGGRRRGCDGRREREEERKQQQTHNTHPLSGHFPSLTHTAATFPHFFITFCLEFKQSVNEGRPEGAIAQGLLASTTLTHCG